LRIIPGVPDSADLKSVLLFVGNELELAMEREAFQMEIATDALVDPGGGTTAENFVLQFVPTAEGYYSFTENRYIYQYKDHLGNTRVSFARNNTTGAIEVTDKNDYYPFGMNHLDANGGSFFGQSSYKNYKYNGKELQETGMYDYGARMYMPDIGRWGVVDPLAEQYRRHSTYNYAMNNPIRFIDPDGRGTEDWVKKDNKWTYDANIKTAEQAKAAGADDFAKNGTVLSNANINGGDAGYVRLNDGGTADYLPNDGAQNQATNASVAFAGAVGSTLDAIGSAVANFFTNNTGDTFYINAGGLNTNVDNTSFRPGIDNVVDNGGYMGGMLNSLTYGQFDLKMSLGDKLLGADVNLSGFAALLNFKKDSMNATILDIDSARKGVIMGKDTTIFGRNLQQSNIKMNLWKRDDSIFNKHLFNK
jgi:RHS repeat-associated protein